MFTFYYLENLSDGRELSIPFSNNATAFFLLMRSSSRARSAEFVRPNLFSSAILHLRHQFIYLSMITKNNIIRAITEKIPKTDIFFGFFECDTGCAS